MLGQSLGGVRPSLGAWIAYTPTVTQSGAVTSFTSNTSRYQQWGKIVVAVGRIAINNAGGATAANDVTVTLPVPAQAGSSQYAGTGAIFDSSASVIYGAQLRIGVGIINFQTVHANGSGSGLSTAGATNLGSLDFTAALAGSDFVDFFVVYEAA